MNQPSHFTFIRPHFGASNPPFEIWMARDRILNSRGRETDFRDVVGFLRAHYVAWTDVESQQQQEGAIRAESAMHENENEDKDTEMEDLAEEMADVEIENDDTDDPSQPQDPSGASQFEPRPPVYSPRTEAEIDRQFDEAFLELELEEAQEAAARMEIADEGDKENVNPDKAGQEGLNGSEHADGLLEELIEQANRVCGEVDRKLAEEEGDDGIL
ncbi:MAG: hypothetical protein Q9225_003974 [Loekoesia sp. 1 TL-2023]